MSNSIVLTVIGEDRPGIVETLSEVLAANGGNWTQSSMSVLAGQFAGLLLASVPAGKADACIAALEALDAEGLTVIARTTREPPQAQAFHEFLLELVGNDHEGIVRDITQALKSHGVNIEELETNVESASMSGGDLFKARVRLKAPVDVDPEQLQQDLEDIADELMVEIYLED